MTTTITAETGSVRNLWGDLPDTSSLHAPVMILSEQAQILEQGTSGLLIGRTNVRQRDDKFSVEMAIIAPTLNNYSFSLLTVMHDIGLYPAFVITDGKEPVECKDQQEFEAEIARVLQSEHVRRVIAGLLAQMRFN
jgi:hypothetical protein